MSKNTLTGGSLLAKLFPTFAKTFLENASQDDVVKAEQEAAVLHQKLEASEGNPQPVATAEAVTPPTTTPEAVTAPTAEQLTAMTTRATTAEAKITELQGQLKAAEADRDKYKAWHDKQTSSGTRLPGNDAANRNREEAPELSTASADALAMFLKRKGQA